MSADVERAAHAYCPRCHPDPRPGDVITALCGARHSYYGRRERPVNTCPACVTLASANVYACGHPGA
ncbi:hypothetical protein DMA12_05855 [Amycolatopsis balhimycina DSM 5908]|jgi:hypothetical protein|uniref:Uncharacterized protein n=1 Tax=Amycolatopsis balhimycina DSM 5908 TaxID=1081091 RepID=A0A428WZY0_AMYBA|nr:hypothetical protein [Amycolatopsis balhimycina]RSM48654.1 hypothetical protein DMA12_05855 [Amycolatopsis balhimycina DSM 5908]